MDTLEHFSRIWCKACQKIQPLVFDVRRAGDENNPDAADIVCSECKSIVATLHARSAQPAGITPEEAAKAQAMAGREVDRLSDPTATVEQRQSRKRRLVKGPKEFRDIRDKRDRSKR
jgi:hypothetical protein